MSAFTAITSVAAYLDEDAVDTDIIFPARFLLLLNKAGLGKLAFHERRTRGSQEEPFILDRAPFDTAQILVAAKDFGTGSSREQAVWALADQGIRCIIAESFGEIFFANCFKNRMLPIVKSGTDLAMIRAAAGRAETMTVDLAAKTISLADGAVQTFEIEAHPRDMLLRGLDEIASILEDEPEMRQFEAQQRNAAPWLYLTPGQLEPFDDLERENALG